MKTLKTLTTLVGLIIVLVLIWTGCRKEDSLGEQQTSNSRNSGLVADDAHLVSKVPFAISSDYLAHRSAITSSTIVSIEAKGRKPNAGIDATPPAVSITSPHQGQEVDPNTITVSVNATDNAGVSAVSLSVNGAVLNTLNTAPYNFSWNAASSTGTTPTLTATAKDKAGNLTSTTITVAVDTIVIVVPPPSSPLPSSYVINTPPVGNQGNEGACVPFSVVYGARSVEEYYRKGSTSFNYSTNIFSPEYVYDQIKVGDCGSGSSITGALDFMYNLGVTTWSTVPFSDVNGCTITPTSTQMAEAANYKIANYSKILSTDDVLFKTMLAANHPVMVGMNIDNNFVSATAGYVWNSIADGNCPHAVIIVGYDDSKNAYRIMNSWGTSWGDAGYLWVDYAVFNARAGYYSYVMNY